MTDLEVKMRVNSVATLTRGDEMRDRLLELAQAGKSDEEVARVLTGEGHRSPSCADKVLPITIQRIRLAADIKWLSSATDGTTIPACSAQMTSPPR